MKPVAAAIALAFASPPYPVAVPPRQSDADPARVPHTDAGRISVVNAHTREVVDVARAGRDDDQRWSALLRDRTTWEEHDVDPACLDAVRGAANAFGGERVEIVSGFRSDGFNEHLRKKGHRVARRSQHVLGHAVDFRIVGVATRDLVTYAQHSHDGGVGGYGESAFVHVDTGPRRRWRGE